MTNFYDHHDELAHPLLAARLKWEEENPRPVQLREAEKMIVRGLNEYGFGSQHQVTDHDRFEIAVDNLLITVVYDADQ